MYEDITEMWGSQAIVVCSVSTLMEACLCESCTRQDSIFSKSVVARHNDAFHEGLHSHDWEGYFLKCNRYLYPV